MNIKFLASTLVFTAFSITPAIANEVVVNDVAGIPSSTDWGTIPGENTGTAVVTSTVARSGNGSLELTGDRTRTQLGIQYAPFRTTIASLADITSLTFDWRIAGDAVPRLNSDYTPALRLLIQDGAVRKELVWEGAYNGTYGNTMRDTWYSTTASDLFYQGAGNENNGMTIAAWASSLANATVSGISVGAGSSAGTGYHAFVDNVSLTGLNGTTTYNFEAAAVAAAVPEPSTWLMMLFGFGMIGYGMRSAKRRSDEKFETKIKNITYGVA